MEAGLKEGKKIDFLMRFDRAQQNSTIRFMIPAPVWKLMRFLNVGAERQLREDAAELRKYVIDIVRKRKASGEFELKDDLLSMYVRTAIASRKGYMMDEAYLFDAILNFMIAGKSTRHDQVQMYNMGIATETNTLLSKEGSDPLAK